MNIELKCYFFIILIFCGCEDVFQRDNLTGSHRIDITNIRKVVIGENHGRLTVYGEISDHTFVIIDQNHGTITDDFSSLNGISIMSSQITINGVHMNANSRGIILYEIRENYGRVNVNGDITFTQNHAYIESNGNVKGDNNHGTIDVNGNVDLKKNDGRISANGNVKLKRNEKEISVNGNVLIEDSNEASGYIDVNGNVELSRNIGNIEANGKVTLSKNEEGGFIKAYQVNCQEDNGVIEIIESNVQCQGSTYIVNGQIICH